MIELYKIFAGKYDSEITEWITGKYIERQYDTRNHRFALQQSHIHYDVRKFSFSNRIIPLWNSLPDNTVSSPALDTFKARLDKFWENQDVRYNWKADILFTGSRSICSKFAKLYLHRADLSLAKNPVLADRSPIYR